MAIVHKTTLVPTKLELLTAWLPTQPWYLGAGKPELARVGGFRLDDPEGEVGIEFMIAVDTSGPEPVTYHLPLTYRGAACAEAEGGFIGDAEHGVLGHRYVYDGTHDPVLVTALVALMQGETHAQAQSISDTPDPTVGTAAVPGGALVVDGTRVADNGREETRVRAAAADARGAGVDARGAGDAVLLRVRRVLGDGAVPDGDDTHGRVVVTWPAPDGTQTSAVTVTATRESE